MVLNRKRKLISIVLAVLFALASLGITGIDTFADEKKAAETKETEKKTGWIEEKDHRWWYRFEDGSYAKEEYIDGCWLDASGWYDATWNATWQQDSVGWWFQSAAWYPTKTWLKIDSKWYHFKSSGYMDAGKWVDKSYVGKDGAWIEGYKNPDGSVCGPSYTIVIDPGHSANVAKGVEPLGPGSSETKAKDNGGTQGVSTKIPEYQGTLTMAFLLKTELESRGYEVILTRTDNNTAISCKERAMVANNADADAYIRLHFDGTSSSTASGAMGICITAGNPYISSMYTQCRKFSDDVVSEYCKATGLPNRGTWETDTMSGNNWSKVPTMLIELGFMTNPSEDNLMAQSYFQTKMTTGLANGIDKYFGY